jgi:hypothetical protein
VGKDVEARKRRQNMRKQPAMAAAIPAALEGGELGGRGRSAPQLHLTVGRSSSSSTENASSLAGGAARGSG